MVSALVEVARESDAAVRDARNALVRAVRDAAASGMTQAQIAAEIGRITPDGQVYSSDDGGRVWRATELLAPAAQALHASGQGDDLEILVADGRTILASTGGQPFYPAR